MCEIDASFLAMIKDAAWAVYGFLVFPICQCLAWSAREMSKEYHLATNFGDYRVKQWATASTLSRLELRLHMEW
ncbi:hypothetical protein B0A49_08034 [Cryomyces minteri]|uniref:Uncharacterized protein n=1 Tax=Cryomyces minteri TaxID=331657 RepID=A0A4U0XFH5_9PEZI|nr:hypothetical protein B0A49_08034 [Cryomyces minteri]